MYRRLERVVVMETHDPGSESRAAEREIGFHRLIPTSRQLSIAWVGIAMPSAIGPATL